jgi:flagellin
LAKGDVTQTTNLSAVDDVTTTTEKVKFTFDKKTTKVQNELTFNLHVGSDADMTNKIGVTIENMSAASLGVKGLNVSDATGKAATYAIDAIADAVEKVSAQRSSLGAIQNRLEHTIANVDNVVENTNAAESRIRDTDMADEMVNYSKNNILQQAGQAMLAQANQATQGVLSILG